MPEDRRGEAKNQRLMFTLASAGLEMVSPMVIGLVLDWYLGSMPWLTIIGLVVGFVSGIGHMVLVANKQNRDASDRKPSQGDSP